MLYGAAVILMMFGLVITLLILVRVFGQWGEKKITVDAAVVSKRSEVTYRGKYRQMPSTSYYAVFRTGSEELELYVEGADYAALKEGQWGKLTYRGKLLARFEPIK